MLATLLLALVAAVAAGAAPAAGPEVKGAKIADEVMKAGGGADKLAAVKYMRFTFAVEKDGKIVASRTHYWDRVQNRHRVEWTDKDGKSITCLGYLDTHEGACSVADKAIFDEEAAPYVQRAYAMWINDTYWLLMPYKMKDPGVHLKYDGQEKVGPKNYDKVMLTFENVGLTPKDRYWAYVDPKTHRMDRWAYVLQDDKGEPGTGDATVWDWKGWATHGGVKLSTEKVSADGKTKILFKDLAVFNEMSEVVFASTAPVVLPPK
jgi:hypothetical protein